MSICPVYRGHAWTDCVKNYVMPNDGWLLMCAAVRNLAGNKLISSLHPAWSSLYSLETL
jgi:hypothetical protein